MVGGRVVGGRVVGRRVVGGRVVGGRVVGGRVVGTSVGASVVHTRGLFRLGNGPLSPYRLALSFNSQLHVKRH